MKQREIKFRAWDGSKIINDFQLSKNFIYAMERNTEGYGGYVLMQYTGLHDKKGKEIYEGDIVKVDTDACDTEYENWKVVWITGGFWLDNMSCDDIEVERLDEDNSDDSMGACYCEVIGNIYENKDLLEK